MSTYLYHLDRASGFLSHTLLLFTWIWVTPGLQQAYGWGLGSSGSWSISVFQASQNLPGLLLRKLCLLCSHDSDWDERAPCWSASSFLKIIHSWSTEASLISLEVLPPPVVNSSGHRGPHMVCCRMVETAFLCHPGHGILSLSIICEAAVVVIDFDLPPCVQEYLNLHQREIKLYNAVKLNRFLKYLCGKPKNYHCTRTNNIF